MDPSQNLHCNPPYHMSRGGAGRPAITETELCADDVGEEDRGGSSATNTSPSLSPRQFAWEYNAFPPFLRPQFHCAVQFHP